MDKEYILQKIQEYAEAHQGKSPGMKSIEKFSNVKTSDWRGKYWARWSDAVSEAGLSPNKINTKFDPDDVINRYIDFIREIGKLPIESEVMLKSRNEKEFPHKHTFNHHMGKISIRAEFLKTFCEGKKGYKDIIAICDKAIRSAPPKNSEVLPEEPTGSTDYGYVYLLKSGKFYKIGRTNQLDRRRYEIGMQLPEEIQTIHSIETDDPSGIEAYWHNRFKDKRLKGEWFNLTASDVKVFRKRKFM